MRKELDKKSNNNNPDDEYVEEEDEEFDIKDHIRDISTASDPIELVSMINQEMITRIPKLRYLVIYSFAAGLFISLIAIVELLFMDYSNPDYPYIAMLIIALIGSVAAFRYANSQDDFLEIYRSFVSSINRAMEWEPRPNIPDGKSHLDRLIMYLCEQDDRFLFLYVNKPQELQLDTTIKGKSDKEYHFDAYYEASPGFFDYYWETIRLFIRMVPIASIDDVKNYKTAVEDVLKTYKRHDASVRFFLLQTQATDFSEDIIEYVNEHYVEYSKSISEKIWEWESPIELLSEDPDGHYNIGSFYFG